MNEIECELKGSVLTVRFNRADKKNSITATMYSLLADTLKKASVDDAVRVVVFQGDQNAFCAGNDLHDFVVNPPVTGDAPVWNFIRGLADFPKPIIAAVCGPAVGIGTTLLLHCELVFAANDALFSLPFVNLGVSPEAASGLLLPLLAGYRRASHLLLLGEPFDAETASEVGIVNTVLAASEVIPHAHAQAAKLAEKPLSALMEAKRLMKVGMKNMVEAQIDEEAIAFKNMITAGAAREAIAAFSEKRKPDFSRF